jgi:hypothetical protein
MRETHGLEGRDATSYAISLLSVKHEPVVRALDVAVSILLVFPCVAHVVRVDTLDSGEMV